MSEMAPEPGAGGGGNLFTNKIGGIPGFVWLLGAGVLAYFLFFRNSSGQSAGSPTTTGGGGQITTGDTTIGTGAVQVTVTQTGTGGTDSEGEVTQPGGPNTQPTPVPNKKASKGTVVFGGNTKSKAFSAPGGKDLNKIAQSLGIPEQQLVAFNPGLRQYVGTGKAIPKGTAMHIPANAK